MNKGAMTIGEYHWGTAHIRDRITPHAMDFGCYPLPFKPYVHGHAVPLGDPVPDRAADTLKGMLSTVLFLSYGVTRQDGRSLFMSRTCPSAGGLYPCHLYLAVLGPAETGLYYYDPPGHGLIRLGNPRQAEPGESFAGVPAKAARLVFMVTADIYNSAWKYRDRAYRYLLLDSGHLVENLGLALLGAMRQAGPDQKETGLPRVIYDFNDQDLTRFLDLDPERELPMALVTVNWDKSVSDLFQGLEQGPVPQVRHREGENTYLKRYPLPARAHASGSPVKEGPCPVRKQRIWEAAPLNSVDLPWSFTDGVPGNLLPDLAGPVISRRSRRNFIEKAMTRQDQEGLLEWILPWLARETAPYLTLALACRDWEGMEDGLWAVDPDEKRLDLIRSGAMGKTLARICLGQDWIGPAAAVFLILADLAALETQFGFRGYRYAMIRAGQLGQRIYLGAESAGLGCCGIGAMYDREANDALGLGRDAALVYALAAGPVKKRIKP